VVRKIPIPWAAGDSPQLGQQFGKTPLATGFICFVSYIPIDFSPFKINKTTRCPEIVEAAFRPSEGCRFSDGLKAASTLLMSVGLSQWHRQPALNFLK
jgi:hypothetical protein